MKPIKSGGELVCTESASSSCYSSCYSCELLIVIKTSEQHLLENIKIIVSRRMPLVILI